jgi:hypothetical protein
MVTLLCWLEGDPMDFDAIDVRVEQAGEQMDADNAICAVALVLCHDLFLFRYKLSMIWCGNTVLISVLWGSIAVRARRRTGHL